MTTDLGDLIDPLQREVSPPGSDLFPDAVDDDWFGQLQDSFWEARLDGVLTSTYDEDGNGVVTPTLPRQLQQAVVIYAGIRIIRNELRNLNTSFRAVAGPVEFEQQKSAGLLKGIYDDLNKRKALLLDIVAEYGSVDTEYLDAIAERYDSFAIGSTYWWTS